MRVLGYLLLLLGVLSSCSSSSEKKIYQIGIDSSFFPLDFGEKQMYVNAFANDLLEEIGKRAGINLQAVPRSWDDLIFDLKRQEYDAILSPMNPTLPNQSQFAFSALCLEVGPVLVAQKGEGFTSLEKMNNAYIGVIQNSRAALFVEMQPNLMPKYYDNDRDLCQAVEVGAVNAAFIGNIFASSFLRDLFQNELKIVSSPFFNQGIRLVVLKDQDEELIRAFDQALEEIKKKGIYDQLLTKWNLK